MLKIRFYHIRLLTLLWVYLVWTGLNLLFVYACCKAANCPLTDVPLIWAQLHIIPVMLFLPEEIQSFGMFLPACVVLSVLLLVGGLLINRWWALFLIAIGMSIWFIVANIVLGVGV